MKKLILLSMLLLSLVSGAIGQQSVAVLEVKVLEGSVPIMNKMQVRGALEKGITQSPGYRAYNRTALDRMAKELRFQQGGDVSDDEIREFGKKAGVDFILVTELATSGNDMYVNVNLLNIETGEYDNSDNILILDATNENIQSKCFELSQSLFGSGTSYPSPISNNPGRINNNNKVTGGNTLTIAGIELVKVEGGSFTMGCTSEQGGECDSDESPSHNVTISPFYIGKYEVTQKQWREITGSNPSNFTGDNNPVENVSWNDIQAFIQELNTRTGKNFRLPTEAEWEYAARGGNKSKGYKYSGSNFLTNVAWYTDNAGGTTHPVGQKQPNELGIYDMSGNVWEWCYDWYGSYSSYAQSDPYGPSSGQSRVLRGGSWGTYAGYCRVAARPGNTPSIRNGSYGFRLVLSL